MSDKVQVEALADLILKHLPGKHDQRSHAGKQTSVYKDTLTTATGMKLRGQVAQNIRQLAADAYYDAQTDSDDIEFDKVSDRWGNNPTPSRWDRQEIRRQKTVSRLATTGRMTPRSNRHLKMTLEYGVPDIVTELKKADGGKRNEADYAKDAEGILRGMFIDQSVYEHENFLKPKTTRRR